jgi:hypothetical protein
MLTKLFKEFFSRQNKFDENRPVKDDLASKTHANEHEESQGSIAEGKKEISRPLTNIGNINSVCPHCTSVLTKKLSRKSKCPHCSQYIYVRTRPIDGQRVLLTHSQVSEIEAPWSNFHRSHIYDNINHREIEIERNQLFKRKGVMLSDTDAKWSILSRQLLQHASNADWGLYRNTRLSMGSVLEHDSKIKPALHIYLEVCYIDINGPRNLGGLRDPQLLKEFPPFSFEESFLAPALVTKIVELSTMLHLNNQEIRTIFLEAAQKLFSNLKLPVAPTQAWKQLEKIYSET